MPLVSAQIPNLINGVSQQPDSLRLPSQAEVQINMYPSVVEGLKDRPPTEHIAVAYAGVLPEAYDHTMNRDVTRRHKALIIDGDLFVNGLDDGAAKTVAFPDGKSYLDSAAPSTDFRAVTVADYTFVVNRAVTVAMESDLTTVRLKEGLVFVKQGNYGSTYKIFIGGVEKATYTTSTTDVLDIATDSIATDLAALLVTSLGVGYTVTRVGSTISIVKASGDFILTCTDSQGGSSMQTFKNTTQSFTGLPITAPNGFEISITNDPGSEVDNYYLRFATIDNSTFGEGVWNECTAQGIAYKLDPATMPHVLIRNEDGTFTFEEAAWDNLTVGDELTAPLPSFVGGVINEVSFFKNRLAFWSDDNTIMSEIGEYFNFFKTTVTTIVDSDPIDTKVNHVKVSLIHSALPFDSEMLLFSDQTQFNLSGVPTLTSKTISILPTTEFENSPTCRPVSSGRLAFFTTENGLYNNVREYSIDNVRSTKDAINITGHVPKYIPTGTFKLASSTVEDILAALTTGEPEAVYVYKYFFAQDEKLQSAWFKFVLGGAGTKVLGADFVQNYLYLTVQRDVGVCYERINFAPGALDEGSTYVTHLDRRITQADCPGVDLIDNVTTWTLPYTIDGDMAVVTKAGHSLPITAQTATTISVAGDYWEAEVYIGQRYTRTYQPSEFHVRKEDEDGNSIVLAGRLQLRRATIGYSDTGAFTVTVTTVGRDPISYVFTGRELGAASNVLGEVALRTGEFSFPIGSKNTDATITITSDSYLPMHLSIIGWEGFYHSRSKGL